MVNETTRLNLGMEDYGTTWNIMYPKFRSIENSFGNCDRQFNINLYDKQLSEALMADRWTVVALADKEGNPYWQLRGVKLNFDFWKPPVVVYVDGATGERIYLNGELLDGRIGEFLDTGGIATAKVSIKPRVCSDGHIKGYVESMEIIGAVDAITSENFTTGYYAG